ncbi:MAG: hypothetical protein WBX04_15135, partial [Candidatus Sulfotelmatobacter sp.]
MSITNITVNGKPLSEHLEAEAAAEIAEVHQAEIKERTWRAPGARSKFGNTSRKRTAPGEVIYTRQGRETHIIIAGTMFPWAEKAPYVRSGESVLGAIEYDEKADQIKCHGCGNWYESIAYHVDPAHGQSARMYRVVHGITTKTSLMIPRLALDAARRGLERMTGTVLPAYSETVRAKALESARRVVAGHPVLNRRRLSEQANLHARCRAQLVARIQTLYRQLDRPLYRKDLKTAGICPETAESVFGTKLSQVFAELRIPMARRRVNYYSDDELLASVRERAAELNRPVFKRDFQSWTGPHFATLRKRFGGFGKA